jgi:hypothetical protein
MVRMFIVTAGILGLVNTVAAQSIDATKQVPGSQPAMTFEELARRTSPGELIYVVDLAGRETRGRVAMLSGGGLTVTADGSRREFRAADVQRIDGRRRDSVRNGVLIGAGAGALLGFAVGRSMDSPSCPGAAECGQGGAVGAVGGAVWGAVGGWIADAMIRKRETVYVTRGSR